VIDLSTVGLSTVDGLRGVFGGLVAVTAPQFGGAVGGDWSAAFEAAFNASPLVLAPAGETFAVGDVDIPSGCTLVASGASFTRHGSAGTLFRCVGTSNARKSNVTVRGGDFHGGDAACLPLSFEYVDGVTIEGATVHDSTVEGVGLDNCTAGHVQSNVMYDVYHGVSLQETDLCRVAFNDIRSTARDSIRVGHYCDRVTVVGNVCRAWDLDNLGNRGAIHFYGARHVAVVANICDGTGNVGASPAIRGRSSQEITIQGNVTVNGLGAGIQITGGDDYYTDDGWCSIVGNHVENCRPIGIHCNASTQPSAIVGNTVLNTVKTSSSSATGIRVTIDGDSGGGQIVGNTVDGVDGTGISVQGCMVSLNTVANVSRTFAGSFYGIDASKHSTVVYNTVIEKRDPKLMRNPFKTSGDDPVYFGPNVWDAGTNASVIRDDTGVKAAIPDPLA
jgi:hypothetical protein